MENIDRCFFCCKNLPPDSRENFGECSKSLNCYPNNASTNYKIMEEQVLRISQYLKVPRTVLEEEDNDANSIKTCEECTEISRNLSQLCVQLEALKLKISHYFNLLADQILEIPVEEDDDQAQIQMSSFQKLVHEKCLFKVQEDSSSLQIDLEKKPDQKSPDHPTDHQAVSQEAEELKQEIKIESDEISQDLQSCPFCDFLVQGPYDLLHSHITAQHSEQFQDEETEEPSGAPEVFPSASTDSPITPINPATVVSTCDSCGLFVSFRLLKKHKKLFCVNRKTTKVKLNKDTTSKTTEKTDSSKETLKKKTTNFRLKCNNCGTSFSSRGNLKRHFREVAACAHDKDNHTKLIERFECSNCNRQYNRLDHIKKHIETDCSTGLLIDHDTGTQLTLAEVSKIITKCEYCGSSIYIKNLSVHISLVHNGGTQEKGRIKTEICKYCRKACATKGNLNVHMLAAHGVEMQKGKEDNKVYKCGKCGKTFKMRRSWMRHVQYSMTCGMVKGNLKEGGIRDVEREGVEGEEKEQESEVILSIPETETREYGEIFVMEVEEDGPIEDPLQI